MLYLTGSIPESDDGRAMDVASLASGDLSPDFGYLVSEPINLPPDQIVAVDWRPDLDPPQCVVTYWGDA